MKKTLRLKKSERKNLISMEKTVKGDS